MKNIAYEPWPALPYAEFQSTAHLLHMGVQELGKLKLFSPFEPHWSNVALWLTARGLTTGPIPFQQGMFQIDVDLIDHVILCCASWGVTGKFPLKSMSVAQFNTQLFAELKKMSIDLSINVKPQEITNPIPFPEDTTVQNYDKDLANAWWRILLSSYRVLQRYHGRFDGETPPIGLMWGTFDLRDARYNGTRVSTTGINAGYIRRNAMNEAQIEAGWWHGNEDYPRPAYYSFTYPKPNTLENAKIQPSSAHWDKNLGEFILDYDELRKSADPEKDLLLFFESTYKAGSERAGWKRTLINSGEPV